MSTFLTRIQEPELFFGFVAPIGTDIAPATKAFEAYFNSIDYRVINIRVTSLFTVLSKYVKPSTPLVTNTEHERYKSFISYGNELRAKFDDDAFLAVTTIARIIKARTRLPVDRPPFEKTVYLLRQFKRKEEIDLLRSVYGRLFFQVSLYSRRGARVDHLSRVFARSKNTSGPLRFRHAAEEIIQIDENEIDEKHGQRVAKIFHDADYLISLEASESIQAQVNRFCELIFSSNSISPNHYEYGMFLAKAAALRTLDLSRQVGAAIFSTNGEIITLGSNEVPRAGGGTYWCDDPYDDREYIRKVDSNDQRKKEILSELLSHIPEINDIQKTLSEKAILESQFMDAMEYGRIVHAEMSAITDAARMGRSIKDSKLFCTTFPCHMCAKHIVASGVAEVIFLEPYPKSLAFDLHADSLDIEGGDRGRYSGYPSVAFKHFFGVTPRRYRELFERNSRKDAGRFQEYKNGKRCCLIDIKAPFYEGLEAEVLRRQEPALRELFSDRIDEVEA